jgi:hypothetical protein
MSACPYCRTERNSLSSLRECADNCWSTRVKPLPPLLRDAVLLSKMTLEDAEERAQQWNAESS